MAFRNLAAAIQDHLATTIAAELPADVPCSAGYPAGGVTAEAVWIAGDLSATYPGAISGGAQRDEAGTVTVRVLVKMTGADYGPARDRALELAGAVEDAISGDPTLGGIVAEAHVSSATGQEAVPDERSREYGVSLVVSYTATVSR